MWFHSQNKVIFLTRTLWGITRNVSSTIKAVFEKCVTVSSQETIVSDISV